MFDMRKLYRALNVYKDHVTAVMDVGFSPTDQGLVSASYDKMICLWDRAGGHPRDICEQVGRYSGRSQIDTGFPVSFLLLHLANILEESVTKQPDLLMRGLVCRRRWGYAYRANSLVYYLALTALFLRATLALGHVAYVL